MPAIRSYFIESIREQFRALLPEREVNHPLGCHRSRIPDRIAFEKPVQVLVFDCAYWRIAEESCSDTTLRRRGEEWIGLGVMDALREFWCSRTKTGSSASSWPTWPWTVLHHQGPLRRRESGQEPGG